jgi:hypothetical protein
MQTATGRWYVEPEAFIEHAKRTVRKLRSQRPQRAKDDPK